MVNVLTKEDLAALLKVEVKTIKWWTRTRLIPFVKIGKVVRYIEKDIFAWVEQQRVDAFINGGKY